MFQELNKVTGGKPRATRRSSGGRRVILKALAELVYLTSNSRRRSFARNVEILLIFFR
jgi:hypothetical protein